MNYNIRFQNVFVMHKIYVLGLSNHIQLKIVNIMSLLHCCTGIADLFNLAFFFCISFQMTKFQTRIHSKSCTVRNVLKKQNFHKYFISIHYYEKKHSFYNSGNIYCGFFNPTP